MNSLKSVALGPYHALLVPSGNPGRITAISLPLPQIDQRIVRF
jgi:hypothetical protein